MTSCSPAQDRTVEDLVEASGRAYDLLEPGLRQAAERYVDDFRRQTALVATQPSIDAREAGSLSTEYESEDGKSRKFLTIKTYVLAAEHATYLYEVRGVSSITMKPSRQVPFEGQIEVLVTQLRRSKERTLELPPMPKGYRPRENAPVEQSSVAVVVYAKAPAFPATLPSPSDPTDLPPELPEALRALAPSLKKECIASEPTRTQKTYVLTFTYSAAEKRWKK